MQTPEDVAYLESAIRDGHATEIMDMVRELDRIVQLLGIADSDVTPSEEVEKLLADAA